MHSDGDILADHAHASRSRLEVRRLKDPFNQSYALQGSSGYCDVAGELRTTLSRLQQYRGARSAACLRILLEVGSAALFLHKLRWSTALTRLQSLCVGGTTLWSCSSSMITVPIRRRTVYFVNFFWTSWGLLSDTNV